jgi:RNA recognition motif-containing protein
MTKLFIGGFPLDITELALVQLVAPYGDVSTIKIVRDKKTRKCKGYAFIEMAELEGAQNAIEALSGTTFGDRELSLNIVQEKPAAPPKRTSYSNYNSPSQSSSYTRVERRPATGSSSAGTDASGERKKRPRKF